MHLLAIETHNFWFKLHNYDFRNSRNYESVGVKIKCCRTASYNLWWKSVRGLPNNTVLKWYFSKGNSTNSLIWPGWFYTFFWFESQIKYQIKSSDCQILACDYIHIWFLKNYSELVWFFSKSAINTMVLQVVVFSSRGYKKGDRKIFA